MKYKKEVYRSLTLILQFGINMLVPIFLCSFAGYYLDKLFGTSFIFIVLFFIGALAGFTNVFKIARGIYLQSADKDTTGKNKHYIKEAKEELSEKQDSEDITDNEGMSSIDRLANLSTKIDDGTNKK